MLGIVGHHLSVGTGMSARAAARITRSLSVQAFELSTIPCAVARGFGRQTGASYRVDRQQRKPQIDPYAPPSSWKRVKRAVEEEGVEIRAIGGYNDFALPEAQLETEKERIIRFCRMAQVLETDVVRVFCGDAHDKTARTTVLKRIIACFKDVIGVAEKAGIYLAIENHLKLVNDADTLLDIIQAVGSPNLKITLDFTNFYWLNADKAKTERMIRQVASYTIHTHFKNARFRNGRCKLMTVGNGALDIERIVDTLMSAGYDRPFFVACESEDFSDLAAVKRGFASSVEYMRRYG